MAAATLAHAPPQQLGRRVFRVRELESMGISQSTAYRRARADGPWSRLAPGIVLAAPGPPTTEDLIEAALLRAGTGAVLTGMHAARRHGLRTPPRDEPVHVLIPHHRKIQSQAHMRFERTTRLPTPVEFDGVPTAPLPRAAMDAVRTWKSRALTESVLIEAIQHRRRCHPNDLVTEMETGSRRGTGLPREILRSFTADLRSVAEHDALKLLRTTSLPESSWNVVLCDDEGRYIARPDIWFDDVGLAVEIDSFEFHFSRDDYAATIRRDARYAVNGVVVLRLLPTRLRAHPDEVRREVRSAYWSAANRTRPPVHISRG